MLGKDDHAFCWSPPYDWVYREWKGPESKVSIVPDALQGNADAAQDGLARRVPRFGWVRTYMHFNGTSRTTRFTRKGRDLKLRFRLRLTPSKVIPPRPRMI